MKDIRDTQILATLDREQFDNVALGLMNAAGATLHRTEAGTHLLDCEDGTRTLVDMASTSVEFLFKHATEHTIP